VNAKSFSGERKRRGVSRERFGATPKGTIDLFRNLKAIEIFCVNTFKVEINEICKIFLQIATGHSNLKKVN
jgi:hypothetical protein